MCGYCYPSGFFLGCPETSFIVETFWHYTFGPNVVRPCEATGPRQPPGDHRRPQRPVRAQILAPDSESSPPQPRQGPLKLRMFGEQQQLLRLRGPPHEYNMEIWENHPPRNKNVLWYFWAFDVHVAESGTFFTAVIICLGSGGVQRDPGRPHYMCKTLVFLNTYTKKNMRQASVQTNHVFHDKL